MSSETGTYFSLRILIFIILVFIKSSENSVTLATCVVDLTIRAADKSTWQLSNLGIGDSLFRFDQTNCSKLRFRSANDLEPSWDWLEIEIDRLAYIWLYSLLHLLTN